MAHWCRGLHTALSQLGRPDRYRHGLPIYMNKITLERWTGKVWQPVLLSPFNTTGEVSHYLRKYSWHFTKDNPYRIKDFKVKKKNIYTRFLNRKHWNTDDDMVTN